MLLGDELLLRAKVTLAHVGRIICNHALLVDGVSDSLGGADSVSICISTLLLFVHVLRHAVGLLLRRHLTLLRIVLGWLLTNWLGGLLTHHGLAGALRSILFRAAYPGGDLVGNATSVDALILGHDLLEGLIIEVATALLFG